MSKLFLALLLVPLALAQSTNINRVTGLVDPGVSGTLGALNAAVTANVNSLNSTATFTVATSGLSNATVAFEGSTDDSTWFPAIAFRADSGLQSTTVANPTSLIGWIIPCGGFRGVRVRVSIYTSGSATGNLRLGSVINPWPTINASTGSSVPTQATYIGGNGSGNLTGLITCDSSTSVSITTAVTTVLISGTSAKSIYICGLSFFSNGTTNIALVTGTGTTCATGIAGLFGGTTASSGWNLIAQTGVAIGGGLGMVSKGAVASDICLINSAAVGINGYISWTKF